MHLSRGYPWKLDLSERELSTIEQALVIVVENDDLDPDSHQLAKHLLVNISNIHDKVNTQKKMREGPQAEEELHENAVG